MNPSENVQVCYLTCQGCKNDTSKTRKTEHFITGPLKCNDFKVWKTTWCFFASISYVLDVTHSPLFPTHPPLPTFHTPFFPVLSFCFSSIHSSRAFFLSTLQMAIVLLHSWPPHAFTHTHMHARERTQALVTLLSLSAAMCFRALFARFALLRTAKESVILKKSACRRFCSVLVRCIAAPDHLPHLPSTIKHGWTTRVGDFGSYSLRPPLLFGRLHI